MKIAAVGTSLTSAAQGFWFAEMGVWLNGLYPGKVAFDNQGIGGADSNNGIAVQLPKALANNPDVVFIEFAINDAVTGRNITPSMSKANLQTMIDTIKAWAVAHGKVVDIVIQTMNNDPLSGRRPTLATYYQGYRDVAAANGLLLIDHNPDWLKLYRTAPSAWKSLVPDNIHPNKKGTDALILPNIKKALLV